MTGRTIPRHDLTYVPRCRDLCPDCEATPVGCRGVRGRPTHCCQSCDQRRGAHDTGRGVS